MIPVTPLFEATKFEIVPGKGAGPIKFGMTRDEIKRLFPKAEEFRKSPLSDRYYLDCGPFHAGYGRPKKCDVITFFKESNVTYKGFHFFRGDFSKAVRFLKRMDPKTKIEEDSAYSDKLKLDIWTDYKYVDTVTIYQTGM